MGNEDIFIHIVFILFIILIVYLSTLYERRKRKSKFIKKENLDLMEIYNKAFQKEMSYKKFEEAWMLIANTLHIHPLQLNYKERLSSYATQPGWSMSSDIDIFGQMVGDEIFEYENEKGVVDLTIKDLIVLLARDKECKIAK